MVLFGVDCYFAFLLYWLIYMYYILLHVFLYEDHIDWSVYALQCIYLKYDCVHTQCSWLWDDDDDERERECVCVHDTFESISQLVCVSVCKLLCQHNMVLFWLLCCFVVWLYITIPFCFVVLCINITSVQSCNLNLYWSMTFTRMVYRHLYVYICVYVCVHVHICVTVKCKRERSKCTLYAWIYVAVYVLCGDGGGEGVL